MSTLEIAANAVTALAIFLAGRNSVHTWWIGIIGCLLFGALFYQSQFYADMTLQVFFVVTGVIGWVKWSKTETGDELPISQSHIPTLMLAGIVALIVGALYALLLHRFTDAYAPGWDSMILVGSVIGQILLMNRKIENWGFWLIVNTIAVPLFYSRGLYLTSVLYGAYWIHAIVAYYQWRTEFRGQSVAVA
jgi:nicotinamide mononucleotide transporter